MSEEELQKLLISYFNNTIDRLDCEDLLRYMHEADERYLSEQIDFALKNCRNTSPFLGDVKATLIFSRILSDVRMDSDPNISSNKKKFRKTIKMFESNWFKYVGVVAIVTIAFLLFYENVNEPRKSSYSASIKSHSFIDTSKVTLKTSDNRILVIDEEGSLKIVGNRVASTHKNGDIVYNDLIANSSQDNYFNNVLTVPKGKEHHITLSDGTNVWMNSGSVLKFPNEFATNNRLVELEGEAYFEVAKVKHKTFKVKANGTEITVLGTHFNVSAYQNDEVVKTTLLEGSVEVFNRGDKVLLKPNQQAISAVGTNGSFVKSVDVEAIMAWRDGYFLFQDADIKSIMKDLARWYDIEVIYSGKITNQKFGGTFSRSKSLAELLQYLESLGQIHFKIEGRRIIVMP